jgi:hypothetical protein
MPARTMEDIMCYVRNSTLSDNSKRQDAKDKQVLQEKRTGLIDRMLGDANRRAQDAQPADIPAKETIPAK